MPSEDRYVTPEAGEVFRYAPWPEHRIDLITPHHLDCLPRGAVLTSISGRRVTKGVDYIDRDTRHGFLAFGLPTRVSDDRVYEGPFRSE